MTCVVEYSAPYSSFTESQLVSMPAGTSPTGPELPQACSEYMLTNDCETGVNLCDPLCNPLCETVASSAVPWDKQQASEPSEHASEYEYSKASHAESLSESSRNLQILTRPWWEGQLAEGIHTTLKNREGMLAMIKLASPQLKKRYFFIPFL